jgi:hypothetical protein
VRFLTVLFIFYLFANALTIKPILSKIDNLSHLEIKSKKIHVKYNPFYNSTKIYNKKIKNFQIESAKKVNTLILGAIINDKAFINGAWHRVGDSIYGFKITKITNYLVYLNKKNKKMTLSTKNSKKILIIKDKNK